MPPRFCWGAQSSRRVAESAEIWSDLLPYFLLDKNQLNTTGDILYPGPCGKTAILQALRRVPILKPAFHAYQRSNPSAHGPQQKSNSPRQCASVADPLSRDAIM